MSRDPVLELVILYGRAAQLVYYKKAFYIGDVMQLRRLTRFVLRKGISKSCLFRRILWMARTLHEVSEAISLVSNPLFSKVSIKISCAASSCGAMVVADTKAVDSDVL
jgi:hypothetical protein